MAEPETGAAEQPAASIRDSLSAAFEEIEKAGTEPVVEAPAAAEPVVEAPAAPETRARDAQGRFIRADGTPEPAAPEAPVAPAQAVADPKAAPAATAIPGEAPQHWSAEDKAFVQKLPQELRAEFVDRFKKMEAGFTPKLQRAAELEKTYGPVDQIFEPHKAAMTAQGWSVPSIVKAWADVEVGLAKDPYAQIRLIAQHYKVDLRKLAGVDGAPSAQPQPAPGQRPDDAYVDPAVKTLTDKLAQLEGTISGMTEAQQRQRETEQRVATQRTLSEIQAFAEARGEDGQPSHPHFEAVMPDILAHAAAARQAGKTPVLQDLYDQAVWANPTTRAKQLAANEASFTARQEAQRAKAATEAKAKANAARKAGSSVTGAPSGGGQATKPASKGSIRDDINAAFEEAG